MQPPCSVRVLSFPLQAFIQQRPGQFTGAVYQPDELSSNDSQKTQFYMGSSASDGECLSTAPSDLQRARASNYKRKYETFATAWEPGAAAGDAFKLHHG